MLFPQAVARDIAVRPVAKNGMADGGQMHADLVRTTRRKITQEEGTAFPPRKELVDTPRLPALPAPHDRHPRRTQRVSPDGRINDGTGMRGDSRDERKVHFPHAALGELPLQCLVRHGTLRKEKTARRVFIEAMREDGLMMKGETPFPKERGNTAEERRRSRLHPRAVMHGDARRLIDHHAHGILVENRQMEICRLDGEIGRGGLLLLILNSVAFVHRERGLPNHSPADSNETGIDHPLRLRPAADTALLHQETIETATRWCDE